MPMMDNISLKSFLTPDVRGKLDKSQTFDAKTIEEIYDLADTLALSVRDATLLAIACSLKKLQESQA